MVECYVGIHVRFCQRVAGVDPAGEVAAVAELRIVGADAGHVADKVGLVLPHEALEVAQLMADGVWDVVAGHLPVIVGLHGKGRVDATELLHGENAGHQQGLGTGVKSVQVREQLSQLFHGLTAGSAVAV